MIGTLNHTEEKALAEFSKALNGYFPSRIKNILLFGSKARGDSTPLSDIDVLVLVDRSDALLRRRIYSMVSGILIKHEVLVSVKIIEEAHFVLLKKIGTNFVKNIEKEGIRID